MFSGRFLPAGPRAFHAHGHQALTRRLDVTAADGEATPTGGGIVHPGLMVLQIGDSFVYGATRADRQLRFARSVQFLQDLGNTARAIEQAQAPAVQYGAAVCLPIEEPSGTAQLLEQVPEVHYLADWHPQRLGLG